MLEQSTKARKRFLWIIVTAIVGAIISVAITTLVQEATDKEPKLVGSIGFNSLAGRELQGQFFTLVGLHNKGDQTLEDVTIELVFNQGGASDFTVVELERRAGHGRCTTEFEAREEEFEVSANCEYLNSGDTYSFSVWHEGLLWEASFYASAIGLTYSEYFRTGYDGMRETCDRVKRISENMEKIPRTCRDSGYWD